MGLQEEEQEYKVQQERNGYAVKYCIFHGSNFKKLIDERETFNFISSFTLSERIVQKILFSS